MKLILALPLILMGLSLAMGSGDFCPRLEGTNIQCQPTPPPGGSPPQTGVQCTPSTSNITCYSCASEGTKMSAVFSSQCESWTCKVELSPEGLPRKTAECGSRTTCCEETISGCCNDIVESSGTRTIGPDCSQSVSCGGGGSAYKPESCSGSSRSCNGAPSCTGEAQPPGDCN